MKLTNEVKEFNGGEIQLFITKYFLTTTQNLE